MTDIETPWLSVLIPVYNVSQYLEECVRSVMSQHRDGVEILLLDDASTDSSATLMQTIASRDPTSIRCFAHPKNKGLAAARNTLLTHARGRYVWFLDSDDLLMPGAIASLAQLLQSQAPDLVLCDFAYVRAKQRLVHRIRGESHRRTFTGNASRLSTDRKKLLEGLLAGGELHAWSKIARREVWQQAPFPGGRYFEDIPTIPALVRATNSFIHVPSPWVGYRQREGSILAKYNATKLQHLLLSVTELNREARRLAQEFETQQLKLESVFVIEDFCLRSVASAARQMSKLSAEERPKELIANYRNALPALFPEGVAKVLMRWLRSGWWLRALRMRSRLRRAEIL